MKRVVLRTLSIPRFLFHRTIGSTSLFSVFPLGRIRTRIFSSGSIPTPSEKRFLSISDRIKKIQRKVLASSYVKGYFFFSEIFGSSKFFFSRKERFVLGQHCLACRQYKLLVGLKNLQPSSSLNFFIKEREGRTFPLFDLQKANDAYTSKKKKAFEKRKRSYTRTATLSLFLNQKRGCCISFFSLGKKKKKHFFVQK